MAVGQISPAEKLQAETLIKSRLNPGEKLLCLCRENFSSVVPRFILFFAVGAGIAFLFMQLQGKYWTLRDIAVWMCSFLLIPFLRWPGRTFAVTNQRLICLELNKKSLGTWINLETLCQLEIRLGNDLRFCFSQPPSTGADGSSKMTVMPGTAFTLQSIDQPEEVAMSLAPYIANLSITDERKPKLPQIK